MLRARPKHRPCATVSVTYGLQFIRGSIPTFPVGVFCVEQADRPYRMPRARPSRKPTVLLNALAVVAFSQQEQRGSATCILDAPRQAKFPDCAYKRTRAPSLPPNCGACRFAALRGFPVGCCYAGACRRETSEVDKFCWAGGEGGQMRKRSKENELDRQSQHVSIGGPSR